VLPLSAKGNAALRRHRRLTLTLKITLAALHGAAVTVTRGVVLHAGQDRAELAVLGVALARPATPRTSHRNPVCSVEQVECVFAVVDVVDAFAFWGYRHAEQRPAPVFVSAVCTAICWPPGVISTMLHRRRCW